MDLFKDTDKLYRLVDENYNLLPVINRFGIRPGFKDKTVAELCKEKEINKHFFLALINTYNNPDYFPEAELLSFSPLLIVEYLQKTHDYYRDYFLPRLEDLIEKLIRGSRANTRDLKMIRTFYDKYKEEFLKHLHDEEENLFPLVVRLVEDPESKGQSDFPSSVESEHSNMEVELHDLKNLLIKYLDPSYNDNHFNEFVAALYQFEKDMADHSRIEDKILMAQLEEFAKPH